MQKSTTKHLKKSSLKHLPAPGEPRKARQRLFCVLFCLLLGFTASQEAWSQRASCTFESKNSGVPWNSNGSWNRLSGPNANPKYPVAGDIVIIKDGHIVSLVANAACASVEIINTSSSGTTTLNIASYTLTADAVTITSSSTGGSAKVQISTGTLDLNGNLTFTAGNSNDMFEFTGGGTLKIAGTLGADGVFTPGTNSTVIFNGTAAQTIPAYTYNNLTIDGSGTKTLGGDISPTGNVTVTAGTLSNSSNGYNITGASGMTFDVKETATFITSRTTFPSFPGGFTNINLADGSTVQYTGTDQLIAPLSYGNLLLSGGGTKTLNGATTIKQILNLASGGVVLGNNDLTIHQTGSISNPSASNYIKQTGTGKLIIQGIPGGSSSEVIFPVGNATKYTPAYITNIGGPGDYSVLVTDGITDNNSQPVTDLVVKRTWDVDRITGTGSPNITLRLQWDPSDSGNGFVSNNVGIAHFTGGAWQQPPTVSFSNGSSTLSATLSGITSFSPFGVVNPNNPLPVELVSFNAVKKGDAAYLQWETASEKNNEGFTIQRSADGRNFENIGFVASHNPNSSSLQQYDFLDKTPVLAGLQYYRLKQNDFNGTVSFSGIKVVDFNKHKDALSVYPNPSSSQFTLNIPSEGQEELSYQILDMTGKTVLESVEKLMKGNNTLQINLNREYPAGIYLLRTQTGGYTTSTRLIKQ